MHYSLFWGYAIAVLHKFKMRSQTQATSYVVYYEIIDRDNYNCSKHKINTQINVISIVVCTVRWS